MYKTMYTGSLVFECCVANIEQLPVTHSTQGHLSVTL